MERARVRKHLLRAERLAARSSLLGLGSEAKCARASLLDELERYRLRGRFPKNRDFRARTPYFVDADGTRCAVAHLLDASGESRLVRKIARERNNARVVELSDEPRLVAWLGATGLTLDEVAAIQPSYDCIAPASCFCDGLPTHVVEAVAIENAAGGTVTASVTRVHRGGDDLKPGDAIEVLSASAFSGSELVVQGWTTTSADGGAALFSEVTFPRGRHANCGVSLTKDEYVRVAAADDCSGALFLVEPDGVATDCDEGCGCAIPGAAGGSGPTSLGVLSALVTLAALRRSRRRSSSPRRA